MAYIECARTPASRRYKEFNVHKEGALQVTSVIKCYKWLLSLGVNARPLLCRVTLSLLSVEFSCYGRVILIPPSGNVSGRAGDGPWGGYLGQACDPTLGTCPHH